jgi:topoisomerase-4 subunit B
MAVSVTIFLFILSTYPIVTAQPDDWMYGALLDFTFLDIQQNYEKFLSSPFWQAEYKMTPTIGANINQVESVPEVYDAKEDKYTEDDFLKVMARILALPFSQVGPSCGAFIATSAAHPSQRRQPFFLSICPNTENGRISHLPLSSDRLNSKVQLFYTKESFLCRTEQIALIMADDKQNVNYGDDSIRTLAWNQHIRQRPGMYIGKLGDGSDPSDGIYVLLKEVIDNSLDEFTMGFGKEIVIILDEKSVSVRDYGRGIPLGSVVKATSTLNTGGRFDDTVYQKGIGMNGVGTKAVNATSKDFYVCSYRNGERSWGHFCCGDLLDSGREPSEEKDGTFVSFTPDDTVFVGYSFHEDIIRAMLRRYSCLKPCLALILNGERFYSEDGLIDLVKDNIKDEPLYPYITLKGKDIEVIMTHTGRVGDRVDSFANGQFTRDGGSHLAAVREAIPKALRDFYKEGRYTSEDCRQGLVGAISLMIKDPVFESQAKIKLNSDFMWDSPDDKGPSIRSFVNDFVCRELDNYLHIHPDIASAIEAKIKSSMKEREEIAGVHNKNKFSKTAAVYNENLRDCRYHYNDKKTNANAEFLDKTSIFITEGKSASGTVTSARDANFHAVFSIRGKSKNSYKSSEEKVIANVEFKNLVAALGIGEDTANLSYNKIVISTDADDDGMHIRMLLLTFFLKYYVDLIRDGHVYILDTPLYRVSTTGKKRYCYSAEERDKAMAEFGSKAQLTRFKGLGEISDKEFKDFIGPEMRSEQVTIDPDEDVSLLLEFFMGNNTRDRQDFILQNMRSEEEMEGVEGVED